MTILFKIIVQNALNNKFININNNNSFEVKKKENKTQF
jgi:hypothetical protein